MESRNPVFGNTEGFKSGGYATFGAQRAPQSGVPEYGTPTMTPTQLQDMYAAPSATPVQTGRMTLDDVIVRTALIFGVLVATAGVTFVAWKPSFGVVLVAALVGLGLGLVNSFKKNPSPPLIMAYAAIEGVFVGGLSWFYEARWNGVVGQAVLGTLAAFATMLALYKTGVIRNSPKFQKIMIIAGAGYLAFGLLHLMGVMFGWWSSVYTSGGILPVLLSAAGVVLASLFLVLDFDYIEQGIRNGLPTRFAWTAAFGLVVTLVWLYLEVLRLLAILRGNN